MSEIAPKIDIWQRFKKNFRTPKIASQIPLGVRGEIFAIALGGKRVNLIMKKKK